MIYANLTGEQQLKVLDQVNAKIGQDPQTIEEDGYRIEVVGIEE